MPSQILPRTAAAFAPRSPPKIVLGDKVEPWLTQTLKRANKIRRPLHTIRQHITCLIELLGGDDAIWDLTTLIHSRDPETLFNQDQDVDMPLLSLYSMVHVQAYIVHVDMISQNEVAFKLTQESIDSLIEYHRDVFIVDASAEMTNDAMKESQLEKLRNDFVQSINRFVFRTDVHALEELDSDGAGELINGQSELVKEVIMKLFVRPITANATPLNNLTPQQCLQKPMVNPNMWWPLGVYNLPNTSSMQYWPVYPVQCGPLTYGRPLPAQPNGWPVLNLNTGIEVVRIPSPTPSSALYDTSSCESSMYNSPASIPTFPAASIRGQFHQRCGQEVDVIDYATNPWISSTSPNTQYTTFSQG